MLEPLDLKSPDLNLHRSVWNLPNYDDQAQGQSSLMVSIRTSLDEMLQQKNSTLSIPLPEQYRHLLAPGWENSEAAAVLSAVREKEITVNLAYAHAQEFLSVESNLGTSPLIGLSQSNAVLQLRMQYQSELSDERKGDLLNMTPTGELPVGHWFKHFFYRFSAQRTPAMQSLFTGSPATLLTNASNLAFCLSQLQLNDSYGHKILCEWVQRVFPSVRWVQAPAIPNNQWHIQCLPRPPEERRNDLAVTLDQMGTGIGNVIAILYIVLVSRRPQVIAIDEPNSFLHPRALRELLQILAVEGSQHQYILTAHSADVLTAVNPSNVTMFSASEGRTSIRQVAGSDVKHLRKDLSDLGIRMTDLHGRDQVLWVEGQTEELVIPDLLRKFCPAISAGTAVLRVEHTGTFEKKGVAVSEVASIYSRLSQASALVPPMVAILLDREGRSEKESERLMAQCSGRLFLLDRPMLEDYVMNAEAIAARLSTLGETCTSEQVQEKIDQKLANESAAKMLARIFSDLSEARHEFTKTRDVPALISWLLDNDQNFLDPLGACLSKLFTHTVV